MAFISTPFPAKIGYGWSGGPEFNVTTLEVNSGSIYRNSNWTYFRHSYDLVTGFKKVEDIETFRDFFIVAGAQEHTFPFFDRSDYKSVGIKGTPAKTDHIIGTGDGTADQEFQLIKIYTVGSDTRVRRIRLPKNNTVLVAWDGVLKTEGADYTVDYETGIITSTVPNNEVITAGYEFYVPCIFDIKGFSPRWTDFEIGAGQAPIIEDMAY